MELCGSGIATFCEQRSSLHKGHIFSLAYRKINLCLVCEKMLPPLLTMKGTHVETTVTCHFVLRLTTHWVGEGMRNRLSKSHCAFEFKLVNPLRRTVGNVYLHL